MSSIGPIAWVLVIVGAINWGLVGLGWLVGPNADWNLVHMILGPMGTQVEGIVYLLVGLSGVWMLVKKMK